jgi:antitoxin (DNA-binding transcriptional repressor) of toxin-antitoxin stability system
VQEPIVLSVTEASRSFADCISRVRYQGASYLLLKGGVPVAKIVPVEAEPAKPEKVHLSAHEFAEWQRMQQGEAQK